MNKERKVGDCFMFNGVNLEVVKEKSNRQGHTCVYCHFYEHNGCNLKVCSKNYRSDSVSVNFIKHNLK